MAYKDLQKRREASKRNYAKRKLLNPEKASARIKAVTDRRIASGYYKQWAASDKGKRSIKSSQLLHTYGINLEQWEQMIALQNGLCLLCKKTLNLEVKLKRDSPVVDHNHRCCGGTKSCGKCIRGIIHRRCNAGIGLFNDDPVQLRLAAEYLEKFGI